MICRACRAQRHDKCRGGSGATASTARPTPPPPATGRPPASRPHAARPRGRRGIVMRRVANLAPAATPVSSTTRRSLDAYAPDRAPAVAAGQLRHQPRRRGRGRRLLRGLSSEADQTVFAAAADAQRRGHGRRRHAAARGLRRRCGWTSPPHAGGRDTAWPSSPRWWSSRPRWTSTRPSRCSPRRRYGRSCSPTRPRPHAPGRLGAGRRRRHAAASRAVDLRRARRAAPARAGPGALRGRAAPVRRVCSPPTWSTSSA